MAAPKLLALHRDVQVLGCDCPGCAALHESEYVAETRDHLDAGLPPEVTEPPPAADHVHIPSFEVIEIRYSAGVPYGIHPCEICGVRLER